MGDAILASKWAGGERCLPVRGPTRAAGPSFRVHVGRLGARGDWGGTAVPRVRCVSISWAPTSIRINANQET